MRHEMHKRAFPASEPERASIRALKTWLLSAPAGSPFDDQLVQLRVAAAIAALSASIDGHAVTTSALDAANHGGSGAASPSARHPALRR